MIFVTVGTQKFQMNRLIRMVDQMAKEGLFREPVFIQKGYSDYVPESCEWVDFMEKERQEKMISECSVMITHAGVGSIFSGLKKGKKVIAMPRLRKYGEHVDDHQIEIAVAFRETGYVLTASNLESLTAAVNRCREWTPKIFVSNNDEFQNLIQSLLDVPREIVFYSPLGANMPPHKIGGAEAACRRTVEVLEKQGCRFHHAAKPTMTDGAASYMKDAVKSLGSVVKMLSRKNADLLYMIGYYDRNIYLEWLMMRIARILGKKVVYEPKNGNLLSSYQAGGGMYRFFLKRAVKCADVVFCQGLCYANFLEKTFGAKCVYIPNYVMQRYLTSREASDLHEPCNLLFFGRLSPEKNIAMMLEISKRLTDRGFPNRLTLIGACDESYRALLNSEIARLGLPNGQVRFTGSMKFDDLTAELEKADFFVFPSANKKEGHSNALTESMAFGVIPVASDAGFNREVIGNGDLVVSEMTAEAYAERIGKLILGSDIPALRARVMARVRDNYSEEIVSKRMETALKEILERR